VCPATGRGSRLPRPWAGRIRFQAAGVGRGGDPFLLNAHSTDGFEPRLQREPGAFFFRGFPPDQAELNGQNQAFVHALRARALAMPAEVQPAEVERHLPVLVRRVAERKEGVGPTGHVAVAGPDDLRVSRF